MDPVWTKTRIKKPRIFRFGSSARARRPGSGQTDHQNTWRFEDTSCQHTEKTKVLDCMLLRFCRCVEMHYTTCGGHCADNLEKYNATDRLVNTEPYHMKMDLTPSSSSLDDGKSCSSTVAKPLLWLRRGTVAKNTERNWAFVSAPSMCSCISGWSSNGKKPKGRGGASDYGNHTEQTLSMENETIIPIQRWKHCNPPRAKASRSNRHRIYSTFGCGTTWENNLDGARRPSRIISAQVDLANIIFAFVDFFKKLLAR